MTSGGRREVRINADWNCNDKSLSDLWHPQTALSRYFLANLCLKRTSHINGKVSKKTVLEEHIMAQWLSPKRETEIFREREKTGSSKVGSYLEGSQADNLMRINWRKKRRKKWASGQNGRDFVNQGESTAVTCVPRGPMRDSPEQKSCLRARFEPIDLDSIRQGSWINISHLTSQN